MDNNLNEKLNKLGFPLLQKEKAFDVNSVLASVLKSKDLRLWEGFPVLLVNSMSKGMFDFNKTEKYLTGKVERTLFHSLTALSLALYCSLGLKYKWSEKLYKKLNSAARKQYKDFVKYLKNNEEFFMEKQKMSGLRLKETFQNYSLEEKMKLKGFLELKDEFNLEFALAQVFSPGQKALFYKKLRSEKLTKTEREYFSRVVKKKLLALANNDLHSLAQKLLQ